MTQDEYKKRLAILKNVYENQCLKGDYFVFEGVKYGTGHKRCKRQKLKDIHSDLIDDVLNWFLMPYENLVFKYLDYDNIIYDVVFLSHNGICEFSGDYISWQMHEVQKNKKIKKYPMEYKHSNIIRRFIQSQLTLTDIKIKKVFTKGGTK